MTNHSYNELNQLCAMNGSKLVIVTKNQSLENIRQVYEYGGRRFAENKVQDLLYKVDSLAYDIEWHLIGHLQKNKVKYLFPKVHCIQSVDSVELYQDIIEHSKKANHKVECLLQFKIAKEETKYGFHLEDWQIIGSVLSAIESTNAPICGVMGMGTLGAKTQETHAEFASLRQVFQNLKSNYWADKDRFREKSMGMSADYDIALSEGSTILRIGSLIFE